MGIVWLVSVWAVLAVVSGQEVVKEEGGGQEAGWRTGRATFYGNEPWAWSIHEGSCGYGYIWEDEPNGWDVAALPDVHFEYAGSCGNCYEIACNPMSFSDNYGNHLDRNYVCKDPEASVVVRITDTCPCNYNQNAYSNKRWCCGDMDHFDLSIWAFEKLTDMKWGVVGLKYRPVPCDYQPAKAAPPPANPFPGQQPDKARPWWLPKAKDEAGQPVSPQIPPAKTTQTDPVAIYNGGLADGWWEKSWNSKEASGWSGPSGGDAFCANVYGYGALAFGTEAGAFSGKVSMELWVRTDEGVPEVQLQLSGQKGTCGMVKLSDLAPSAKEGGYERYTIYLGLFDFGADQQRVVAFASEFLGCGGNSAGDIKDIYIRNDMWWQQFICVDNIKLL